MRRASLGNPDVLKNFLRGAAATKRPRTKPAPRRHLVSGADVRLLNSLVSREQAWSGPYRGTQLKALRTLGILGLAEANPENLRLFRLSRPGKDLVALNFDVQLRIRTTTAQMARRLLRLHRGEKPASRRDDTWKSLVKRQWASGDKPPGITPGGRRIARILARVSWP